MQVAAANMADYMRSTPQGDPYLDFSALSRDQTTALSEVMASARNAFRRKPPEVSRGRG